MRFNNHSGLSGRHAFLSPSNYHWINYDQQKLAFRYADQRAAQRGTDLHDFCHEAIRLGVRLPEVPETLSMYVNDAIDLDMSTEVALYYSDNCFGHADTMSFDEETMLLRIHDLKTGIHGASQHQLEVYAALFCLEYIFTPFELEMELRIYQNNDVRAYQPYRETIAALMDKIVNFNQIIEEMKAKGV